MTKTEVIKLLIYYRNNVEARKSSLVEFETVLTRAIEFLIKED